MDSENFETMIYFECLNYVDKKFYNSIFKISEISIDRTISSSTYIQRLDLFNRENKI